MCQGGAATKSTVSNTSHRVGYADMFKGNAVSKGALSNAGHLRFASFLFKTYSPKDP